MGLWELIKVDEGVGYAGLRCRVFLGVIAFLGFTGSIGCWVLAG